MHDAEQVAARITGAEAVHSTVVQPLPGGRGNVGREHNAVKALIFLP
jgi:hypothetical protein